MPDPLYIEIGPLLTHHLTGVGRFVGRLLAALGTRAPLRLVSCLPPDFPRRVCRPNALVRGEEIVPTLADLPDPGEDLGDWAGRLLRLPRGHHDLNLASHSPILFTFLRPSGRHFRRELCLVHDLVPILLPGTQDREIRDHFHRFCSQTAGQCDKLIANSLSTQADAAWLCSVNPGDVILGYPGPSLCDAGHACPEPVERRGDVLLVVSTLEPRKNGPFLLDWFLTTEALPPGVELWWVGPQGWWTPKAWLAGVFGKAQRERQDRVIRFLGFVPDRELCKLYRRAAFTIYPSLYEGFGFPVLDSLLHETPVLCSYHSSLREFAGPGVYYFDAGDPASLDDAYRAFRNGPTGVHRDDLRRRFAWDRLAETVLRLSA